MSVTTIRPGQMGKFVQAAKDRVRQRTLTALANFLAENPDPSPATEAFLTQYVTVLKSKKHNVVVNNVKLLRLLPATQPAASSGTFVCASSGERSKVM